MLFVLMFEWLTLLATRRCLPQTSQCARSEEHTSELQSLRHLVCRLLLEKKKNKIKFIIHKTKYPRNKNRQYNHRKNNHNTHNEIANYIQTRSQSTQTIEKHHTVRNILDQ